MQIDIENPLGTKIGSGPITSATGWKFSNRLDRAGDFSFQMPIADPQYATLANRVYVRCRDFLGGVLTELGVGVVDSIVEDGAADPTMVTVSGSNLMRELTRRSVKSLVIGEAGFVLPEDVHYVALDPSGSGMEANPNNYDPYALSWDGNVGTNRNINLQGSLNPFRFYVGFSRPFSQIYLTITQANADVAVGGTATFVQYFNGTAWVNLTFATNNYVDSTRGGPTPTTLYGTGSFTWNIPTDWVPLIQNCVTTGGVVNNKNCYWVRFAYTGFGYVNVHLAEINLLTTVPTLTGPQLIMALAPAGWTLTGYTTTLTATYLQLGDETVLDALGVLAGITGEHFLLPDPGLKQLGWIRTDAANSGVRATRNGDPASVAADPTLCLIKHLKTTHDSHDMVSRVIPYGSGQAGSRTTLALTTRSAPGGYVLDTANNNIKYAAGETAYGQVEKVQVWSNIGPATSGHADQVQAANALFDAAIYWLTNQSVLVNSYDLEVVGAFNLTTSVRPGYTIRVDWLEIINNVTVRSVNADLIVLENAATIDQDGVYTVTFMVSNLARWPLAEIDALAKLMGNVRAMTSIPQSTPLAAIGTGSNALSVVRTAGNFGGLNYN